jgi:hypothetical protein
VTESPETPTPSLADRRSEFLRWLGRYLRKQEGWWDADEWDEVMWGEPHGTGIAGEMESGKLDAQLRQLDRIKAAYEAVKDEHLASVRPFRADCSNAKCAHLVASLIDELDALEVPDA